MEVSVVNPISVNAWVWKSPPTDEWLEAEAPRIRDLGFDAIELPVEEPGDWNPQRTAELLQDLGLEATVCAVMAPGRDFLDDDPEVVEATHSYIRYCVDAVHALGGGIVAGPIYSPTGKTWRIRAEERERLAGKLVESLKPFGDYASERGVQLALEPLNRFETSFINTTEQAMEVVEAVGSPAVGLLLDTFHMNIEEKSFAEAIHIAGSSLFHFHACGNDRGAPGDDHIDWAETSSTLEEVGYGGHLCIESFTAENEAIATATSIWRPLAPSQDEIATRGLDFLRGLPGTSKNEVGSGVHERG